MYRDSAVADFQHCIDILYQLKIENHPEFLFDSFLMKYFED